MKVAIPHSAAQPAPEEGAVVTKAVLRAAALLGLSNKALARIIGVSEASISRMGVGTYTLAPGDKPFELAVLFIRFYRSLDALVLGDDAAARAWIASPNAALGGSPAALIQTLPGLVHAVAYLDAHRALV
jgi:Antitoxin Xre/MbcA/ParS C-terminal toxin-binding domain/Antitoxin Xre-like helix-turn-helix domain